MFFGMIQVNGHILPHRKSVLDRHRTSNLEVPLLSFLLRTAGALYLTGDTILLICNINYYRYGLDLNLLCRVTTYMLSVYMNPYEILHADLGLITLLVISETSTHLSTSSP